MLKRPRVRNNKLHVINEMALPGSDKQKRIRVWGFSPHGLRVMDRKAKKAEENGTSLRPQCDYLCVPQSSAILQLDMVIHPRDLGFYDQ